MNELEKQLQLKFFFDNGFDRKQCSKCKSWFWTIESSRTTCGDAPCVEYEFLGAPLTSKPYDLGQMREKFLSFFEQSNHTRVPRYPVVARWREDIYLTIASIADFQPWVTSGQASPPANPLCISQPCIRLNDLANVGKSGRHMTTFEMMAHHAFNRPGQEIYWADETVAYCDQFLTQSLDMSRERITYKENPWAGGGNAGPAVEVLAGGLEVATLVFMNLQADPSGSVDVKGEKYSPLELRIVDTGWGLERLTWASKGTPTAYEAAYPELVEYVRANSDASFDPEDERTLHIVSEHARLAGVMDLDANSNLHVLRQGVAKRLGAGGIQIDANELQRVMEPFENAYALSDHAKCLAFMLGDGIVPSNAKAGYLARLIVRRSLRLIEALGFRPSLRDLVFQEMEFLGKDFPELRDHEDIVGDMLELETERYRETMDKGKRMVRNRIKRGMKLDLEQLIELYDSHGLPPGVVQEVAKPLGVEVDIPDAFDVVVADRHSKAKAEVAEKRFPKVDVPATKMLYYEEPDSFEFDASVLWSNQEYVVVDQTMFYPEGGGQPCDHGILESGDVHAKVLDVQRQDGVVFHRVDHPLKVGEIVHGRVDRERRLGHMRHHTATHIVNGAARAVLGDHAWQTGAQKHVDYGRIDITHYKRLTPSELREIEKVANDVVTANVSLERQWMDRDQAERKHGVRIYQGGVAPGGKIRVIRIGHHDVEACGGTHAPKTSDVGLIKIYKSERIQDGVERLEYCAGPKAIEYIQRQTALLEDAAKSLSVPAERLPQTVERFFQEWKQRGKEVEQLREELGKLRFDALASTAERIGSLRLIVFEGDADQLAPLSARVAASQDVVAILGGAKGSSARVVVACGTNVEFVHAGTVAKAASEVLGGNGGGKPNAGQGGGPNVASLGKALEAARQLVKQMAAASSGAKKEPTASTN